MSELSKGEKISGNAAKVKAFPRKLVFFGVKGKIPFFGLDFDVVSSRIEIQEGGVLVRRTGVPSQTSCSKFLHLHYYRQKHFHPSVEKSFALTCLAPPSDGWSGKTSPSKEYV